MIIGVTVLDTEFLSVGTVTGGPPGAGELIGRCSAARGIVSRPNRQVDRPQPRHVTKGNDRPSSLT
jgi:hypothetical protein